MQIQIQHTGNQSHAFMLCELCEKPIESAQHAEYVFEDSKPGTKTIAVVGHKECTQRREGSSREWEDKYCNNLDVENLLAYLAATSNVDFARLQSEYETIKNGCLAAEKDAEK